MVQGLKTVRVRLLTLDASTFVIPLPLIIIDYKRRLTYRLAWLQIIACWANYLKELTHHPLWTSDGGLVL